MFLIGIILGVGLFFLVFIFSDQVIKRNIKNRKKSRDYNSGETIRLDVATIADDMLPLINPHILPSSRIVIVGSDGAYTYSENGRRLIKGINSWLKKGAHVDYLLLSGDFKKTKAVFDTKIDYPNFSLTLIDRENCKGACQELRKKYLEFHPVLVSNGDKLVMWVEKYHKKGQRFAYDIEFTSPKAMNSDRQKEFEIYSKELNMLIGSNRPK